MTTLFQSQEATSDKVAEGSMARSLSPVAVVPGKWKPGPWKHGLKPAGRWLKF